MSNYRRLISYIYAYEGQVKGKNIGFVKLESRGGQCKLSVNVKKVYVGGSDLGVYLLAPGKEICLGSIFIRSGAGEFRTVVNVDNAADSGVGMDYCYGLTIHEPSDSWRCYTTIWEDAVAHAAEIELADVTAKNLRNASEDEEIHKKAEEIAAEMDREIESNRGPQDARQGDLPSQEGMAQGDPAASAGSSPDEAQLSRESLDNTPADRQEEEKAASLQNEVVGVSGEEMEKSGEASEAHLTRGEMEPEELAQETPSQEASLQEESAQGLSQPDVPQQGDMQPNDSEPGASQPEDSMPEESIEGVTEQEAIVRKEAERGEVTAEQPQLAKEPSGQQEFRQGKPLREAFAQPSHAANSRRTNTSAQTENRAQTARPQYQMNPQPMSSRTDLNRQWGARPQPGDPRPQIPQQTPSMTGAQQNQQRSQQATPSRQLQQPMQATQPRQQQQSMQPISSHQPQPTPQQATQPRQPQQPMQAMPSRQQQQSMQPISSHQSQPIPQQPRQPQQPLQPTPSRQQQPPAPSAQQPFGVTAPMRWRQPADRPPQPSFIPVPKRQPTPAAMPSAENNQISSHPAEQQMENRAINPLDTAPYSRARAAQAPESQRMEQPSQPSMQPETAGTATPAPAAPDAQAQPAANAAESETRPQPANPQASQPATRSQTSQPAARPQAPQPETRPQPTRQPDLSQPAARRTMRHGAQSSQQPAAGTMPSPEQPSPAETQQPTTANVGPVAGSATRPAANRPATPDRKSVV